jgi:hypothetical protein
MNFTPNSTLRGAQAPETSALPNWVHGCPNDIDPLHPALMEFHCV